MVVPSGAVAESGMFGGRAAGLASATSVPWTGSALLYWRSDLPLIAALLAERNQHMFFVDHLLQPVFQGGQERSRVSGVAAIAFQLRQSSLVLNDPQHAFRDFAVDFQQMIFLATH